MPCVSAIPEHAKGLRVGTQLHYSCARCKRDFGVSSNGSIAFALFAAVFLSAIGWLVVVQPPGSAVGAEESNRWFGWVLAAFGAAAWIVAGSRIVARLRHPIRT